MRHLADRDTKAGSPGGFVEQCGGFGRAVAAASSLSRAIWRMRSTPADTRPARKERSIDHARLMQALATEAPRVDFEAVDMLLALARDRGLCWHADGDGQAVGFSRPIVNPLHVARALFADLRPDYELKYFVMRDIRHRYRISQSSEIAHRLHAMADGINQRILARVGGGVSARLVCPLQSDPDEPGSTGVLDALAAFSPVSDVAAEMFLECCRVLNYLQPSGQPGEVELRTRFVDAEYMLSWLFGVPTRIKGFDSLFGGGGLMLAEATDDDRSDRLGGRSVLTTGPSGSGKSLLTLQMAVDVARKGGAAWVMPLEQTAEECLYALQSIGALPADSPLRIATTVPEALDLLENPDGENGALILLRTIKGDMDDFLAAFEENVHLMSRYPLRLIAVDSVSALTHSGLDITGHRARTLQTLESLKHRGTNIWLVAEENAYGRDTQYEQNIADTVISLGVETRHDYSQRYIEVRKSRLQREQRGQHPFAIGPGTGLTVFPSSAAVKSRIKTRALRAPTDPTVFGLPSLDEILGRGGLYVGDVAVLQGPTGCSKTPLGITFLLSPDFEETERRRQRALLVSAEHNDAALRYQLAKIYQMLRQQGGDRLRLPTEVRTLVVDGGYVKPGYILQLIEDEFERARLEATPIGRVMIDNVAHWELSCPFVRDDRTFGDTLIDLLRAHRVTTLLTCAELRADSVLSRSVVENADCLIHCERAEYRGRSRVMVRIVKTRDMGHRGELFELMVGPGSLRVETSSSLLRLRPDGRLNSVPVRLFLRGDSDAHHAYNRSIQRSVKGVLSRDVELEHDAADQIEAGLRLASASAVDELQVLQLDEFEVPAVSDPQPERFGLKTFTVADVQARHWDEMLPRLRTRASEAGTFLAVPYYVNVALLACRGGVDRMARQSWVGLASECERWERAAPAHAVFFDLPPGRGENYNCLFFEILASLEEVPEQVRRRGPLPQCAFLTWVTSPAAVEAIVIMRRLTRRAWLRRREEVASSARPIEDADPSAQVWRHWFGTLHQMCSDMGAHERAGIEVGPLPGEVSVAGEWFLGIPSYSAAPEVGLRVIDMLTTPEAELDRLKAGVGLPTRESFFLPDVEDLGISPFFSIDGNALRRVVDRAVRRSDFGCYRRAASTVSAHLQAILAAPLGPGEDPYPLARRQRDDLRRRLELIVDERCRRCGGS